jgi:ubiquinone/menaquinone biosynthesis C-methylase UbiE
METVNLNIDRRAFFNEVANQWDKNHGNSVTPEFLEMLIARLNLEEGQRVLDVGTGTGILIPFLSKAVGDSGLVVAIDFSEKMVEVSTQKFSALSNVRIELKNAEELDYPKSFFDAVICFGVFPHIQNKEKALTEMNNVLKSKGKLLIAHALGSKELNQMHGKEAPLLSGDILQPEREVRKLLSKHGFKVEYVEDKSDRYLCLSIRKKM